MTRAMVLVVERDAAIRELLRAALECAGYGVVADAGDGVPWAGQERPDLILLDASDPAAAAVPPPARPRLRAAPPIPIIAMTTAPPSARAPLAVDAWLAKPFRLAELYAAVARWTGQPSRSA
jgi:DNA-binding response OmpR family regulator